MFGWTCMQFMNVTCMVIPFLNLYLTGVAMTCITTFIFGLIRIVLLDNTDCESSFGINLRTQKQLEHEKSADEIFSYLNLCCIIVHLFWFLFGSINFLPLFFTEGLYIRRGCGSFDQSPVDQRVLLTRVFLTRVSLTRGFLPEDFWPEGFFDERVY